MIRTIRDRFVAQCERQCNHQQHKGAPLSVSHQWGGQSRVRWGQSRDVGSETSESVGGQAVTTIECSVNPSRECES